MTTIENLESNKDVIRYSIINGEGKLLYSKGGVEKVIEIYKGEGDKKLLVSIDKFKEILDKNKITIDSLGNSDNGEFKIVVGTNTYTIESKDSLDLVFNKNTTPVPSSDLQRLQTLINLLLNSQGAYQKYIEYFKRISKREGFLVKLENSPEEYDWMFVKKDEDYELFIPKDTGEDSVLRAYLCKELDNHSIDLSFKRYPVESDFTIGVYDSFEPIPKNALVELELEDKRVVYIDLYDGVDLTNGIVVKDMNISSQRVIKNIRIYYEIN